MKYMLIFMDCDGGETIVEECLERQEAIDRADGLQKDEENGYYVVMDEELKEVIHETWEAWLEGM